MEQIRDLILNEREEIIKISISSPFSKDEEFNKITIRPVIIKKKPCFQAERFKTIIETLKKDGIEFKVIHGANSAGIMDFDDMLLN